MMNAANEMTQKLGKERQKVFRDAESFTPLLNNPDLTEEEINAAIEALRSLRMHIHAIDYGDAPGFRNS